MAVALWCLAVTQGAGVSRTQNGFQRMLVANCPSRKHKAACLAASSLRGLRVVALCLENWQIYFFHKNIFMGKAFISAGKTFLKKIPVLVTAEPLKLCLNQTGGFRFVVQARCCDNYRTSGGASLFQSQETSIKIEGLLCLSRQCLLSERLKIKQGKCKSEPCAGESVTAVLYGTLGRGRGIAGLLLLYLMTLYECQILVCYRLGCEL